MIGVNNLKLECAERQNLPPQFIFTLAFICISVTSANCCEQVQSNGYLRSTQFIGSWTNSRHPEMGAESRLTYSAAKFNERETTCSGPSSHHKLIIEVVVTCMLRDLSVAQGGKLCQHTYS